MDHAEIGDHEVVGKTPFELEELAKQKVSAMVGKNYDDMEKITQKIYAQLMKRKEQIRETNRRILRIRGVFDEPSKNSNKNTIDVNTVKKFKKIFCFLF